MASAQLSQHDADHQAATATDTNELQSMHTHSLIRVMFNAHRKYNVNVVDSRVSGLRKCQRFPRLCIVCGRVGRCQCQCQCHCV